ncbi:MAG: triose-phosphate isomerase [Bacteroidales bacterium]|nr:triose-phosphate isomerase [Candidatus Egerieousia equi]
MRKNIVAGNWKMNTTVAEGIQLAKEVVEKSAQLNGNVKLILGTPFTHLYPVAQVLKGSNVGLAAQNCADQPKGAYTGEVSVSMLKSVEAQYCILGHSERREYYGETSEKLVKKMALALEQGISPIFCVGEKLEQREAGEHYNVVKAQIEEVLFTLTDEQMKQVIVAYEPVWAIGTGKTATAEQAQEIHNFIRKTIAAKFGQQIADDTTILYGGSCKPSNAKELFACPDIDGGLIGGASLKSDDFVAIAASF